MQVIRWLLFPFSLLYLFITESRNFLYNKNFRKSVQFSLPIISVGNLSTGGTGKTPHIEYLISLLCKNYHLAVLSRGYGRRSKGFKNVLPTATAYEVGDEPLQIKNKFPSTDVYVCEERVPAIPQILIENEKTELILLDDAFQHRKIKPGLSILLMDYTQPFYKDIILPTGNLREHARNYKRANIIIVTKCPPRLKLAQQQQIIDRIKPIPHQKIFFSTIVYANEINNLITGQSLKLSKGLKVISLTGVADDTHFISYLKKETNVMDQFSFFDHHRYNRKDIQKIKSKVDSFPKTDCIITTEKDATKLYALKDIIEKAGLQIYILPISIIFLDTADKSFDHSIFDYLDQFKLNINE